MPHPDTLAVRTAAHLTQAGSNRLVLLAAMDDITTRRAMSWQWSHTRLAHLLGVDNAYLTLVQAYLEHRRAPVSRAQQLRRHARGAEIYCLREERPLNILGIQARDSAWLPAMLKTATHRRVSVEPELAERAEKEISLSCGMSWKELCEVHIAHRAAASRPADAEGSVA